MKHIYLDKFFYFFLLVIVLTGNFNYFLGYFSLLFIHEIGHAITGIVLGYKLKKIVFYPLGGITTFCLPVNIPLKKEFLILIMGPVMQIIGYLFLIKFYPFIRVYHYSILIFNLLPLYPLDGGKILNILCNYRFNYLKSFKIVYCISLIMIIFLLFYCYLKFNLNLLLMIFFMSHKLFKTYKNRFYYYQRFLLERYLYHYYFPRLKYVDSIKEFYRDCEHIINYQKEQNFLKKYFMK